MPDAHDPAAEAPHQGVADKPPQEPEPEKLANAAPPTEAREGYGGSDGRASELKEERAEGRVEPEGGADAREPLATFSGTAVRQESDGMVRFELRKDDFQEQTGKRLDRDKVLAIEGQIVGVGSFRKVHDGSSEGERLAFFAPKEASDSIRVGEKYDVRVDSVKEVSASREGLGTFFATAYRVKRREGREDSVRLDIPTTTFEKRTKFHFEDGKTSEVKGEIDGRYEFKLTHTGSRENQHIVISVSGEGAKKVEVGREHTVAVESIEEKRTLTVTGEGPTTRLTLQKRMLESLGIDVDTLRKATDEGRLVELTVRNLSPERKSEETIYGRLQPREGALPLSIGNVGGKPGDVYELVKAREHSVGNFVEGFNKRVDGVTRNVRLSLEGEKLYLQVDGKKFETRYYQLGVHRLQTFLNLEVEPLKQDIRFWIEGDRTTAKLAQSSRLTDEGVKLEPITWRIKSFAASERGLEVTFMMGSRMITARAAPESLGERMSMEKISERVQVVADGRLEGNHAVRIEDDLVSYINNRITRTKWSNSPYFFERGGLGEDIGAAVLSKMGLDEVERHSFDLVGPGREPNKTGSDALYKNRKTGELVLIEFRWWQDSDMAMERGLISVKGRQRRETYHQRYGEISGAYVAVLKLDLRSNRGELRVKRAW